MKHFRIANYSLFFGIVEISEQLSRSGQEHSGHFELMAIRFRIHIDGLRYFTLLFQRTGVIVITRLFADLVLAVGQFDRFLELVPRLEQPPQ